MLGWGASALWPSLLAPDSHGDPSRCAVSASGTRIDFADGVTRLDGTSGLWNVHLGYGNEAIALAVADALRGASYLSVFRYENVYARGAADALVELAGAEHFRKVCFSTSGGAANDLVMKLARHHHELRADGSRKIVVGLRGSYHGLTFGAYALTGEDMGQRLNGVDQRLVRHVEPNDTAALERLCAAQGRQIAAVVVEPLLGSGAVELDHEYVSALLRLRAEHGFLVVADEVATGFGRTGTWFASDRWPERPDMMVVSKGLTNGTQAAAAVIVSAAVAETFHHTGGMPVHAETQAGTPPTCAAILATVQETRRTAALDAGLRVAERLDGHLDDLVADMPIVSHWTGRGCFRSVRLLDGRGEPLAQSDVGAVVDAVRHEGAIVHPGVAGIQLVPALVYTDDDLAELFDSLRQGLERYALLVGTGRP